MSTSSSDTVIPRGEDGLHTYAVFYHDSYNRVNWVDIQRARTIQEIRRGITDINRVKVSRATQGVYDWAKRMKAAHDEKLRRSQY